MGSRLLALLLIGCTWMLEPGAHISAQTTVVEQGLAERCRGWVQNDPAVTGIAAALALSKDRDAVKALDLLEESIRAAAVAAPDDVEAQYHLAALLGARTQREGGRKKIAAAKEMHALAMHVLAIDPQHAGANYLVGRLHAGVMRMDRVTRFLATHLLGGAVLKGASWEASQRFFEAAESNGPCTPEHHFELGRLYAERRQPDLAGRERHHVSELTTATSRKP